MNEVAESVHRFQKEQSPIYSHLYSSRPVIHTYNSEWIDSPDTSPSKPAKKMTTQVKYETPLKNKASLSYITPTSVGKMEKTSTEIHINEKPLSGASTPVEEEMVDSLTSSLVSEPPKNKVEPMDVFWAMVNNVTGKDKLAKFGQYSLRLLLHQATKTERYLSDTSLNIGVINSRYNDKEKKLNLFKNFLKHPQDFMRIVVILLCSVFVQKLTGLAQGLGTYRQFLRFGKTPFRIRLLYQKLLANFDSKTGSINTKFFSNQTLGEVIGFYYGFNDEANLLYKLKLLRNKTVHDFTSKHESWAWYYDSWFALYNAYVNLNKLAEQEMEIKIQIRVKKKAKLLSKQLLHGSRSFETLNDESPKDSSVLKEIQFKKTNAYLDIFKNLSDITFNSYTVFHMALPFDTLQILMGISASSLSCIKIYRETKKKLEEK